MNARCTHHFPANGYTPDHALVREVTGTMFGGQYWQEEELRVTFALTADETTDQVASPECDARCSPHNTALITVEDPAGHTLGGQRLSAHVAREVHEQLTHTHEEPLHAAVPGLVREITWTLTDDAAFQPSFEVTLRDLSEVGAWLGCAGGLYPWPEEGWEY